MVAQSGTVHKVSWRDCCPWVILFRTFRLAVGAHALLLASAGAVINSAGWRLADSWFLEPRDTQVDARLAADVEYLGRWPSQRGEPLLPAFGELRGPRSASQEPVDAPTSLSAEAPSRLSAWLRTAPSEPVLTLPYRFVAPVRRVLDPDIGWRSLAFYLFGSLWTLAVWAFVGGVITRGAAVYLGREERVGLRESYRHACRKWGSHLAAPWLPLLGVIVAAVPMAVLGWFTRFDMGVLVAGLLWIPLLLGAFVMMFLLLGLLFGWPLMWGTIGAEGSDAFDAISRAYAYTFQRPLQYLFYAAVGTVAGLLGWLLVWGASESVVHIGYGGASWGAGSSSLFAGLEGFGATGGPVGSSPRDAPSASRDRGPAWRGGVALIEWGVRFVRTLASAYAYSFFWCVVAAIYLLLRSDADHTEMDDVWLEDESRTTYGLPALIKDEEDVPGIDEPAEKDSAPSEDASATPDP